MNKNIFLGAILLACSLSSFAQSTNEPAAELNSTPPAQAPVTQKPANPEPEKTTTIMPKRKLSYGLSAGTQYSRLYGATSYLEPSVMFPVTKRFSGFASLSFVNSFGPNPGFYNSETAGLNRSAFSNQRYILNAGGNYVVNERLNLTGSVWRDFSKNPLPAALNVFNPGGTSGVIMRANYKITDNLSVSGGFRVSNGNGYNGMWYNPGMPYGF